MQEVTDAQEDRRLTEEYRTHDLKKRTWSNRWICIKMKNSASTLKFLVESLFKLFCCFIRFDWWCRFFWVTVKIKVENFDWWKCLLVVIRSLFCNFFGSLINTLLLFSVTLIFILNEKDLCLRITARIKPRVLFSGITISLHISYSVMETWIGRLIVQLFSHFLLPDGINWANHCNTLFQIRSGLYSVTMQSDFWSISSQMLRRSGGHIAGLPQQATVQPPTCSNCRADHKKPAAKFAEICHWQILIVLRWKMIPKCASVVSQSCQSQLLVEWNQKHFCTCPVALVVKIKQ